MANIPRRYNTGSKQFKVNIVFLGLRLFLANWRSYLISFLIILTFLFLIRQLETRISSLVIDLKTTTTDDLSLFSLLDRLTIVNVVWFIVKSLIEIIFAIAIITLSKFYIETIEKENKRLAVDNNKKADTFVEAASFNTNTSIKQSLVFIASYFGNLEHLKVLILAVWRSFQFIIILSLLAFTISLFTYNLGESILSLLYIVFRIIGIIVPYLIAALVIFRQKSFYGYLVDLKNILLYRGEDFFNVFIFVIFTLVLTPSLMIAIVALFNYLGNITDLTNITNFINSLITSYLTGFFSGIYAIVISCLVYVYYTQDKTK